MNYRHPDLAANIWKNERETFNGKDDDGNGYVDDDGAVVIATEVRR